VRPLTTYKPYIGHDRVFGDPEAEMRRDGYGRWYAKDEADAVIRELEAERDAARAELKQAHIAAWAVIRATAGEGWLAVPSCVLVSARGDFAIERIDNIDGFAFRAIDAARSKE
jgi:hypothetical protein